MDQQDIREYNGQRYSPGEGAAIIKELDDRTRYDQPGYNSVAEIGSKVKTLVENPVPGPQGPPGENGPADGTERFATLADINALTTKSATVQYVVDQDGDNNGYYTWDGVSATVDFNRALSVDLKNYNEQKKFAKTQLSIPGRITGDGSITNASTVSCTDFIGVNPLATLTITLIRTSVSAGLAWYDIDKNFISHIYRSGSNGGIVETLTAPSNAYFFRTTYWNNAHYTPAPEFYFVLNNYPKSSNNQERIEDIDYNLEGYLRDYMPSNSNFKTSDQVLNDSVGFFKLKYATDTIDVENGEIKISLDASSNADPAIRAQGIFDEIPLGEKLVLRGEVKFDTAAEDDLIVIFSQTVGTNYGKLQNTQAQVWIPFEIELTKGDDFNDNRLVIYVENQVVAATGSVFFLRNLRLNSVDRPYLIPKLEDIPHPSLFNAGGLPNFNFKTASIAQGNDETLVLGLLGDSWTQSVPNGINFAQEVSKVLRLKYGDGGGGWYDFARSGTSDFMRSADIDDAIDTRSGSITYSEQFAASRGVCVAQAVFNNASSITLNILKPQERLVIHYLGGGGVFTYSLDGEDSVAVDTSGQVGHQTIVIDVTDAPHILQFNITSGSVLLFGVDMQRTYGVRVHKMGNRGIETSEYGDVEPEQWKDHFNALSIDCVQILLGTNDRTANVTPFKHKQDMQYLIDMIRSVNEHIDIALVSPSNNKLLRDWPSIYYAKQQFAIAKNMGLAYVDLIPLFGSVAKITAKPFFVDTVHPNTRSSSVIARHLLQYLYN